MKEIHAFHSAITKASHETSRLMSARLREEAHASGWPSHVVKSLGVSYSKEGFQTHVREAHHAEALDHEYGTPSSQPNAAIRRSTNSTHEAEHFLTNRIYKHLEGML